MSDDQRFAPPQAHVEDVGAGASGELAGRGARLAAVVIDLVIAMCVGIMLSRISAYTALMNPAGYSDSPWGIFPGTAISSALIFLVLHGWLLVTRGQTIGKAIVGLRIVRSDGSKVDAVRLLGLRYGIGYLLSVNWMLASVYGILDALLIFRGSRQCLHDSIADTKVIKV